MLRAAWTIAFVAACGGANTATPSPSTVATPTTTARQTNKGTMMNSPLMNEIADKIDSDVRMGFDTRAEIVDGAIDLFGSDEGYPGDAEIRRMVDKRIADQLTAQVEWQRPTHPELLVQAFAALDAAGIVARHNYMPTRAWSAEQLVSEEKAFAAKGRKVRGFVYYTTQDAESVTDGRLSLAFTVNAARGWTEEQVLAASTVIAQEVVAKLEGVGLEVTWNGDPRRTLLLPRLDWRAPRKPDGEPLLPSGPEQANTK